MDRNAGPTVHEPLVRGPERWTARVVRAGRWESPVGFVVGLAILSCGALATGSCVLGLVTDGRDVSQFAILGVLWCLVGAGLAGAVDEG